MKEKEKRKICVFKVTLPARDGEKIKILQNWQNIQHKATVGTTDVEKQKKKKYSFP